MQFPYVIAVAPNNSQKCGKWQHLAANQAIFQIQGDKTQEMYDKHLLFVQGYRSEARHGRPIPPLTTVLL